MPPRKLFPAARPLTVLLYCAAFALIPALFPRGAVFVLSAEVDLALVAQDKVGYGQRDGHRVRGQRGVVVAHVGDLQVLYGLYYRRGDERHLVRYAAEVFHCVQQAGR